MSKRLIVLFCVLFVFAAAMPAFAAVQNIKVSGDILAQYIDRNQFDLSKDLTPAVDNDKIGVFNTITRIRIDADLTDNVSTVIRLINERNWDEATAASTDIDLDLAYVTLKEFLYSPLTLTIGRQELHFGNDMIIGDGVGPTNRTTNYSEATGWNSKNGDLSLRKSFDAIRATLNYDPLVIDMVYAKIRANLTAAGVYTNSDYDLWGVNAGYKFSDKWNSMAEGYFWSKINRGTGAAAGYVEGKHDTVNVVGGRVSTNPLKQLNLQQEFAYQFGEYIVPAAPLGADGRDRSAFAAQTMAMLTPGWKYQPTMGMIYSYFSGSNNPTSTDVTKKYHGWDPMFENQTAGSIINALYSQSNSHNFDVMAKMSPMQDVWLRADYVVQLLAKEFSTDETSSSDYGSTTIAAHSRFIGQELDLNLVYNYTEDVQLGLLCGWFFGGSAIANDTPSEKQNQVASEAIASCKVSF